MGFQLCDGVCDGIDPDCEGDCENVLVRDPVAVGEAVAAWETVAG